MNIQTIDSYKCEGFCETLPALFLDEDSPLAVNHTQDHMIARVVKGFLACLAVVPIMVYFIAQRPIAFADRIDREKAPDSGAAHIATQMLRRITFLLAGPFLLALCGLFVIGEWLSGLGYAYDEVKGFVKDRAVTNEMINGWCRQIEEAYYLMLVPISLAESQDWYLVGGGSKDSLLVKKGEKGCETICLWSGEIKSKSLDWFKCVQNESEKSKTSSLLEIEKLLKDVGHAYGQVKEFVKDNTVTNEMINYWCRQTTKEHPLTCASVSFGGAQDWYLVGGDSQQSLLVKRGEIGCETIGLCTGETESQSLEWFQNVQKNSKVSEINSI